MGFIWILRVKYICHLKYIFIFLCLIKLSPNIIYLLHIKMLYFALSLFFSLSGCVVIRNVKSC